MAKKAEAKAEAAKAAVARLEVIEREAALREHLFESDIEKLDAEGLERAIGAAREKGANDNLIAKAAARLQEWRELQARIAEANKKIPTWMVVNPAGFVNIRTKPDAFSPVLATLQPGEVLRGVPEGDWIRLYDRPGYMLVAKPNGEALLRRYEGASADEGGEAQSVAWALKFFAMDRLAREGFVFLAPEHHNTDYCVTDTAELGHRIHALGQRLYDEGSLPGNPTWEMEESPEFVQSLAVWKQAVEAKSCAQFDKLLQKAADLADEGYQQMGNLAPRLAILRWNCCMNWLAARSKAVTEVSGGNSFGQLTAKRSDEASRTAKHTMFDWLRSLTKEWGVLTMFDYDLVGEGVWHDYKREPLLKRAHQEWFRRGMEFDIIKLCYQALQVPPEDLNPSAATIIMVQPYLTPAWVIPPEELPGHLLRKHDWFAKYTYPQIDDLHTKGLVQGKVLHIEQPPEYQHDFSDPEVIAKVERGEDLGKGSQEDGLPGALHGSLSLIYAAYCTVEKVKNLHIYPGLLGMEGFLEKFLEYCPPIQVLELSGSGDAMTEDVLKLIGLVGRSLFTLDLSECALDDDLVDPLIDALERLPNLQHIDLANNNIDSQAALRLLAFICESHVDIPSIRLDGNPLGDPEDFKNEVAAILAARGESVIAGGEMVLHFEEDMIRWYPKPKEGQLAHRIRNEVTAPQAVAIKEVRNLANAQKRALDKYENTNPAATTAGGRDWLARRRQENQNIFDSHLLQMYKADIQHRIAEKEAQEAAEREAREKAAAAANEGDAAADEGGKND